MPGCQRRAREADIDHLIEWDQNGRTSAANCHPLCPHHPKMTHEDGWSIVRRDDGSCVWTSPTGRVYVKDPTELPH